MTELLGTAQLVVGYKADRHVIEEVVPALFKYTTEELFEFERIVREAAESIDLDEEPDVPYEYHLIRDHMWSQGNGEGQLLTSPHDMLDMSRIQTFKSIMPPDEFVEGIYGIQVAGSQQPELRGFDIDDLRGQIGFWKAFMTRFRIHYRVQAKHDPAQVYMIAGSGR